MTTAYDLYAIEAADLQGARRIVESALALTLAAHESGFHGGEYFRASVIVSPKGRKLPQAGATARRCSQLVDRAMLKEDMARSGMTEV